jgi:aminoglycoside phosphotransferase (APT) family kinase protein
VSGPEITIDRARDFLADRYGGRADQVEALGGGDWSRAFGFRHEGRNLVVRFGVWREDFEKDRSAMAFAGRDLPVPQVLEIGDAFDGVYAISARHFGLFLEELDAEQWQRVLPAVLGALDAMRAVPVPLDIRGQTWGEWLLDLLVDDPGKRVHGWRPKLAASAELDGLFVAGQRTLEALLPSCPDLCHVLHLDLLNRNVLVVEDASRLEVVFDWGCLAYGDFVYEVAWFCFWAPWYPGLAATDMRAAVLDHYRSTGLAVENFDGRLRCYEIHIGLHHLAYNAFRSDRQADLAATGDRLRALL